MPENAEIVTRRLAQRRAGIAEANIQADVAALLRLADLDLDTDDLLLESPAADRRRIDIELGRTVIEIKRNVQRADLRRQGESQLVDYLCDREAETGARYVGVLTDGKYWLLYRLGDGNVLKEVAEYTNRGNTHELVLWLEGALASKRDIAPTPVEIEHRMGVDSTSYMLDFASLLDVYSRCSSNPEVVVKQQLWRRLMSDALGKGFSGMSPENQDLLFVRHTYLVAVAEVLAHLVIGAEVASADPQYLMSGAIFRQLQISGVVEADFFDWVTDTEEGRGFVRTLPRRLARFDFAEPSHDVLKVLYESVIDSKTRHSLGEYYTPDWLAEQIVDLTVDDPLTQTVLDPACGSGTFLFWSVRKVLEACEGSGMSISEAIEEATRRVIGIDLHPVAVTLARVTVLLAIGRQRLQDRRSLAVQVYLGDSMMWRQPDDLHGVGGLTVFTSDGGELFADQIVFPEELLSDMDQFDRLLSDLTQKATGREPGTPHPSIAGA